MTCENPGRKTAPCYFRPGQGVLPQSCFKIKKRICAFCLYSPLYLARFKTTGANPDPPDRTVQIGLNELQVGRPFSLGADMGVADLESAADAFCTNGALPGHVYTSLFTKSILAYGAGIGKAKAAGFFFAWIYSSIRLMKRRCRMHAYGD